MSFKSYGPTTMTVPQIDNVKVSQREKRVFVSPDLPLSNVGHLLPGKLNASHQHYGKSDKFEMHPQDAVHLQSTDFLNLPDTYDLKKAGILCTGTAKSQSSKKAMAPRSNQDFPDLLETDLTEKPRKLEKEKESQEGSSFTDTITDVLFSQLSEADEDASVLDLRMSLPSTTQSHVTLNQNQDLTPDILPSPDSQYTLNPWTKVWTLGRRYPGNPQWALESVCCGDQGIKDRSHLNKTGLPVLHEDIEFKSDTGQKNWKKQMVQDSGGMSKDEVTYENLLIEIDSTDLIWYNTGTNNAKKECYGELSKDTVVIKNQKYHGTKTTAASSELTCGDLLIDPLPGIVYPKEVSHQHSLKEDEIIKNQKNHGSGTAVSGPITCGGLPTDPEMLKLLECVIGMDDSMEESQEQLQKDPDLMKNRVAHETRPTAFIAPACGNLLQNTGMLNLRIDTRGADFEKVAQKNLLKDHEWVKNQMGHHTGMAPSQAVGFGDIPTELMNRTVHDTKTADRKEEAYETLPEDAKLMENKMPFFSREAPDSKSVVYGDLFTEIKLRKEQMSYDTGAVNTCTNNGVFNGTEGLRTFAQNHTRLSSSVYTDEMPKTSTKTDLTVEMMTPEEIMSENAALRRRLVKKKIKRKLQNRTNEPAAKVMKKFQNDCQIGVFEENGEVVGSSEQGLTESNIFVEKQFPMFNTWEYQHAVYQAKLEEPSVGNMPNLDDLGINM